MDLGNRNCLNLIGFRSLPAVPPLWAVRKYEKRVFLRDGGVTPSLAPDRAFSGHSTSPAISHG